MEVIFNVERNYNIDFGGILLLGRLYYRGIIFGDIFSLRRF